MVQFVLSLLSQCETWACLLEHKADVVAGVEERHTKVSRSLLFCLSLLHREMKSKLFSVNKKIVFR